MSNLAFAERYESRPKQISDLVADLGYSSDWNWAWDNYKTTILELANDGNRRRHLEIGAGRDPLFQPEEAVRHGLDVTLNDISAAELALAPSGYRKVECDISSPTARATLGEEAYDLVYCRMVMEHISDVPGMWNNIGAILAPGGVALSFFPTLYAPPYLLNHLLPERASRWLLETVFPHRRPEGDNPKFPAHYNFCFSEDTKITPMLKAAGFSAVHILPFWGYSYFWRFPGIKQLDAAFTKMARGRDWRAVSSFAYVIAVK